MIAVSQYDASAMLKHKVLCMSVTWIKLSNPFLTGQSMILASCCHNQLPFCVDIN